jgi:hypothetical protein
VWGGANHIVEPQLKSRIVADRQPRHGNSMRCLTDMMVVFMRRLTNRRKPHYVERELPQHLIGDDEMTDMRRVERAAEQTNLHFFDVRSLESLSVETLNLPISQLFNL